MMSTKKEPPSVCEDVGEQAPLRSKTGADRRPRMMLPVTPTYRPASMGFGNCANPEQNRASEYFTPTTELHHDGELVSAHESTPSIQSIRRAHPHRLSHHSLRSAVPSVHTPSFKRNSRLEKEASKLLEKFHRQHGHSSVRLVTPKERGRTTSGNFFFQHSAAGHWDPQSPGLLKVRRFKFDRDDTFSGSENEADDEMSKNPQAGVGIFQKWDMDEETRPHAETLPRRPPKKPKTACGRFRARAKALYNKLGINRFLLILIMIAYAAVGGAIFWVIEAQVEIDTVDEANAQMVNDTIDRRNWFLNEMSNAFSISCERGTNTDICDKIASMLEEYDQQAGLTVNQTLPIYKWDYINSIFYAGTIFTTIGYGNMSCKTLTGKIVTLIYATFGIPLMLTMLNDLGKMIFSGCRGWWNWSQRMFKRHVIKKIRRKQGVQSVDDIQKELEATQMDDNFPMPLAMIIVLVYILLCSLVFMLWEEEWDYFDSFYFFFISMSTIGFGDVMPSNPHITTAFYAFLVIGLALVSMCINVMQAKVEAKYMAALEMLEEAYMGGDEYPMSEASPGAPPGSGRSNEDEYGASMGIMQASRGSSRRKNPDSPGKKLSSISESSETPGAPSPAENGSRSKKNPRF